ncbi:MAG: serine hydrolase [Chitinophagaceae bacterium]|nr:serine hydrolase [Chitinophagaceae bacterium]
MRFMIYAVVSLALSFLVYNGHAQTYTGTQDGKALRKWWVAGPMTVSGTSTPDNTSQETFFNRSDDQKIQVSFAIPAGGSVRDLKNWKEISWNDDIIDLDSIFKHPDYVSAYAFAVIVSDAPKQALLGVGSDDALKVWVNGKLVHKNWMARGVVTDNDVIPVSLNKGKNEILLEVQDITGGWAFTARFLDKKALAGLLIRAARNGDLDEMNRMLGAGADPNAKGEAGYTAIDAARISGREEAAQLLISKGAKASDVPAPDLLVDGIYSQVNAKSNPGIAVLVAKDGKIVYEKGYGYADIDKKVKVTPETQFRIGSITKQFIATAILKLQEAGKISVNDKLSKFFPDFPRGNEVTIHHLLTHTSGIHSFTNKDSFLNDVVKPITNEQLLNYFKNDPYDFNPGERYQYNNSGYFLLGYIIEKITGDNYGAYLKKEIFDPLGMTHTGVHSPRVKLAHEALGYEKSGDGYKRALDWNMDWAGGAGSLYSTVGDLYKWNEALFNNKVLKPESLKAAFTPVVLNNGSQPPGVQYGYGWGMGDLRGAATIGHSGGLHGFISQLQRVRDKNLTVVLLTNVSPPQVEIDPNRISELYLWKDLAKQESFAQRENSEDDIEKYTGRYDFSNGAVMLITKEGDGLHAQLSGQPKFPIFPSGKGKYFWKVVPAKIEFVTDASGKVTHGNFEQGSFKVNAPRMKDIEIVKVDTAVFEQYKGVYTFRDTELTITSQNGHLYGQAKGDALYELLPLSETEYLINELNARLTFKKEPSGKVNTITIKVSGIVGDAVRK